MTAVVIRHPALERERQNLLTGIRHALRERDMRAVAALLTRLGVIAPHDAELIRDTIDAVTP